MLDRESCSGGHTPAGSEPRATGRRFEDGWFRSLVEQSLAGVYVIQGDRFAYVNPRFAELFGYTIDEIVGRKTVGDLVTPRDRAIVRENIRQRLEGEVNTIRYTFRGCRSDGQEIWVEVHGTRTELESEPAVVGLLVDVTEQRHAIQERERLFREARNALEARDEVLAIVSHDLRNPLNAMLMSTELLLTDLRCDDPAQIELLERMKRTALEMEHLIRDLLDASAMEAGQLVIDPQPLELRELIYSALDMLDALATEKEIDLTVARIAHDGTVLGDGRRLLQVLSNLCGNAIKFTPAGGRIEVGTSLEEDGEVRVQIRDSGPGIPREDVPHLFDRFWKRPGAEGAGLGLAISKGIVEAHGGRIWVETEEGAGTTFTFTIPVAGGRGS